MIMQLSPLLFLCCILLTTCELAPALAQTVETTATAQGDAPVSAGKVKELLREFHEVTSSSAKNPNEANPALLELRGIRPITQLAVLYGERDPAVMELGGVFFGIICRYVAPEAFLKIFADELDDPDPSMRTFASEALGELGRNEAIPLLKALLRDERVNFAAACSLAWLGNADGFNVMFEWAEHRPDYWEWNVLIHFRRFSDQDFKKDLAGWREHFRLNPPRPPRNEPYRWSRMIGEGPKIPVYILE